MKIASKIHPRSGKPRRVTILGRLYAFAPVEDKLGNLHYVADVSHEEHAAVLLGSDAFYRYTADMAPQAMLQQPAPKADGTPAANSGPSGEQSAGEDLAIKAEAEQLLTGSASAISAAVGKVSSLAVVRAALDIEKAGAARKNVTALLNSTIEGAVAAGVAG